VLRAIMDISARAFSLTDRPQRAIGVTSVRTRSEDRSSILSSPLAGLGWKLLIGLRHRLLVMFDCVFAHLVRSRLGGQSPSDLRNSPDSLPPVRAVVAAV
jgi:hypothetical protein